MLGLNDFQTLNGLAGHVAGERMLQEIARRIDDFSVSHGRVGRLDGNVFGLLVGQRERPSTDIEGRISAVVEARQRPGQVGRSRLKVTAKCFPPIPATAGITDGHPTAITTTRNSDLQRNFRQAGIDFI